MNEQSWFKKIFREMHIDGVSGRLFHCDKNWNMKRRVLGDDMFFYVIKGSGSVTIEDRHYAIHPGVCAHFPREVPHSASHDPQHPIDVITLHYNATIMQSLTLPMILGFPDIFVFKNDRFVDKCFRETAKEALEQRVGYERAMEAQAIHILLRLIRMPAYCNTMKVDYQEARHSELLRLYPALKRISANLDNPDSIEKLAQITGYSIAQFRRVFTRTLRMSPVQYLRSLRMTRACQLLRRTTQTIEEISAHVGYQETSFFARTFKKLMGTSPGNYRRRNDI